MNSIVIRLIVNTLSVFFAAWILQEGVELEGFATAILVAVVLALLNLFIKPILVLFTLPATIFTFGLFLFVINALIILLADNLIPDAQFAVHNFWWALLFSLIVSLINSMLYKLGDNRRRPSSGPPNQPPQ